VSHSTNLWSAPDVTHNHLDHRVQQQLQQPPHTAQQPSRVTHRPSIPSQYFTPSGIFPSDAYLAGPPAYMSRSRTFDTFTSNPSQGIPSPTNHLHQSHPFTVAQHPLPPLPVSFRPYEPWQSQYSHSGKSSPSPSPSLSAQSASSAPMAAYPSSGHSYRGRPGRRVSDRHVGAFHAKQQSTGVGPPKAVPGGPGGMTFEERERQRQALGSAQQPHVDQAGRTKWTKLDEEDRAASSTFRNIAPGTAKDKDAGVLESEPQRETLGSEEVGSWNGKAISLRLPRSGQAYQQGQEVHHEQGGHLSSVIADTGPGSLTGDQDRRGIPPAGKPIDEGDPGRKSTGDQAVYRDSQAGVDAKWKGKDIPVTIPSAVSCIPLSYRYLKRGTAESLGVMGQIESSSRREGPAHDQP
jgi:hypothetical protein